MSSTPAHITIGQDRAMAYANAIGVTWQPALPLPPMIVVLLSLPYGVKKICRDAGVLIESQHNPTNTQHLVHYEEDIAWYDNLWVDTELQVTPTLLDAKVKHAIKVLHIGVDITDQHNKLLAQTRTALFVRDPSYSLTKQAASVLRHPQMDEADSITHWQVPQNQATIYAEASGDTNPLHLDDAFAQKMGLTSRVLHGLSSMAFVHKSIVETLLDHKPQRLQRLKTRFMKPVYMGDTISCYCKRQTDGSIDTMVTNQHGEIVIDRGYAQDNK